MIDWDKWILDWIHMMGVGAFAIVIVLSVEFVKLKKRFNALQLEEKE